MIVIDIFYMGFLKKYPVEIKDYGVVKDKIKQLKKICRGFIEL